ncbi:hypothetical protein D3C81_2103620 [compost metagenome]
MQPFPLSVAHYIWIKGLQLALTVADRVGFLHRQHEDFAVPEGALLTGSCRSHNYADDIFLLVIIDDNHQELLGDLIIVIGSDLNSLLFAAAEQIHLTDGGKAGEQ